MRPLGSEEGDAGKEAVDNRFATKKYETIAKIQRLADRETPVFLDAVAPWGHSKALPGRP
jgi:hypothetical protein